MVNVGGEKMSKSLGNFTTIRALLDSGVSPMTLRLFVLQAHYRKPLDFTLEALDAAATGWKGLSAALAVGHAYADSLGWGRSVANAAGPAVSAADPAWPENLHASCDRFREAMDDDLNTAAGLGELFELARPLRALANRLRIGDAPSQADQDLELRWHLLVELAGVLGLAAESDALQPSADGISDQSRAGSSDAAIEALVDQRQAAKAARDYATADRLRDELKAQGIELVDKPGGVTVWLRS
jgi:cysteinyl-tRNA synthetase